MKNITIKTAMKTIITYRSLKSVEYASITDAFKAVAEKAKCPLADVFADGYGINGTMQIWIAGRNLRSPFALKSSTSTKKIIP